MRLLDPADGDLLDDGGLATANNINDPHGGFAPAGSHVHRPSRDQLSQLHQLHVPRGPHHGHCCGALWPSQQSGSEDHHDGGNQPGEVDVGLHVHDDVSLHVDFQYSHHCYDVANC